MRSMLSFSVGISLAVGSVGCSVADPACRCSTGNLAILGNPNPPPTVTELADTPPKIANYGVDFGAVAVGAEADGALTFANTGASPLQILGVSAPSDAEFSLTLNGGTSIEPGAMVNVPLSFKPFSAGEKAATIVIQTDSMATPTVTLNLSGTGTN
jgi:Abnormal spindle-like microcephaly-assoc'd, ASPM-SPD-2-Hydin